MTAKPGTRIMVLPSYLVTGVESGRHLRDPRLGGEIGHEPAGRELEERHRVAVARPDAHDVGRRAGRQLGADRRLVLVGHGVGCRELDIGVLLDIGVDQRLHDRLGSQEVELQRDRVLGRGVAQPGSARGHRGEQAGGGQAQEIAPVERGRCQCVGSIRGWISPVSPFVVVRARHRRPSTVAGPHGSVPAWLRCFTIRSVVAVCVRRHLLSRSRLRQRSRARRC